LEIDESNLTGENKPRRKISEAISTSSFGELALNERENIAFMGTLVRNGKIGFRKKKKKKKKKKLKWLLKLKIGRGEGIVVATGKSTEFGHVFELMQEVMKAKTM
jgi:Ca2+-transporting ATPase